MAEKIVSFAIVCDNIVFYKARGIRAGALNRTKFIWKYDFGVVIMIIEFAVSCHIL